MYNSKIKIIELYINQKGGELMKEFNKLIGYRNRCGLSQKAMGEFIGITAQAYGRKENHETQFTRDEMKTLHNALETELNEPISFTELFNI